MAHIAQIPDANMTAGPNLQHSDRAVVHGQAQPGEGGQLEGAQ